MVRRRRSLHFVPGGNDRMLAKALALPADGLILDLEDAVAPDRKAATRGVVSEWLGRKDFGGRERWVRMNPIATGLGQADIEETLAARPDGYVVPKPGSAADIREVARILDRLEQRHGIPNGATRLTLIATETPAGLLNIREIATATPRTVAISWGVEDLGAAGRAAAGRSMPEGAAGRVGRGGAMATGVRRRGGWGSRGGGLRGVGRRGGVRGGGGGVPGGGGWAASSGVGEGGEVGTMGDGI